MTDPQDDLAGLMSRLRSGSPANEPERELPPPPPPMYLLSVDTPDERSIVLVVEQTASGVWMATIALPRWHELPEGWDGPHTMKTAINLANGYAEAYGYSAIAIDIPSSQLWREDWGKLQMYKLDDFRIRIFKPAFLAAGMNRAHSSEAGNWSRRGGE